MTDIKTYLSMTADERYAVLEDATIAAVGESMFAKYYDKTKNRWLNLASIWGYKMECALHHIYWGVYPYDCDDPNTLYLCSLMEAELLDDGEAFNAWSKWSVFEEMLEDMTDRVGTNGGGIEIRFIEHHKYLRARLLCKVKYSKTRPFGFDEYQREYEDYEKIVTRFVPVAANWDRVKWSDDRNVALALNAAYGVDYCSSETSMDTYDRVIMMCRELDHWGCTNNALWYAANIELFPLAMAKVLWPVDLEANVTKLFLAAYEATVRYENSGQLCLDKKNKHYHPVGHFEREALKASWLYQNVSKWYIEGKYSGQQEKDVKKALFNLLMIC